jgi:hypothetical protein
MLSCVGCKKEAPTVAPIPVGVQEGPVFIDQLVVSFHKDYTVALTDGRMLKVRATRTSYDTLYEDGVQFAAQVEQKDGKWVDFECSAIADKIIEPGLIPQLDKWCKLIHDPALLFWKDHYPPREFTDDQGQVWVMKP